MENAEKPFDRRSVTSRINGLKGGRPRVWKINPYEMIRSLKRNPSFYAEQDIKELQAMIANVGEFFAPFDISGGDVFNIPRPI